MNLQIKMTANIDVADELIEKEMQVGCYRTANGAIEGTVKELLMSCKNTPYYGKDWQFNTFNLEVEEL